MQPRSRIARMGRVYSRSKSKAAAMAVIEEEIGDLLVESRSRPAPPPSAPFAPETADEDHGSRAERASRALTTLMADEASADTPPAPPVTDAGTPAPARRPADTPVARWFDWLRVLLGLASPRG